MKKFLIPALILVIAMACVLLSACAQSTAESKSPYYTTEEYLDRVFNFTLNEDNKSYLVETGDVNYEGVVVIPSIYKGLPVTRVEDAAFADCHNYTKIIIPDSVTYIGDAAFSGCFNLTSIIMGNGVTYIGNYLTSSCQNLKRVNIPDGVTHIGEYAFNDARKTKSITIPVSVTYIGAHAFASLESITYKGTKAQWNNIEKSDYGVFAYEPKIIHCTDGDISSN